MQYYNFDSETEQFPKFLTFDNLISQEEIGNLINLLELEKGDFIKSQVYNVSEEKNEYNDDIRLSKKISINDPKIFDIFETLIISKINNSEDTNFILSRDEIDIIKYDKGDYFKKHQDFVKFNSNIIKSYAFILCLKGNNHEGFTKLFLSDNEIVDMYQTCTPGSALLFRNEIFHEGTKLDESIKIILKLNILGIKKKINITNYNDLLKIKFKEEDSYYVIPLASLEKIPKSYLYAQYHFEKKNEITINDYSYKEFKVIYDCLTGSFNLNDYDDNKNILDYFGIDLCGLEDILEDLNKVLYNKIDSLNRFLKGKDNVLIAENTMDYLKLKKCFGNNPNIIPIQFFEYSEKKNDDKAELFWLNIFEEAIPVYYTRLFYGESNPRWIKLKEQEETKLPEEGKKGKVVEDKKLEDKNKIKNKIKNKYKDEDDEDDEFEDDEEDEDDEDDEYEEDEEDEEEDEEKLGDANFNNEYNTNKSILSNDIKKKILKSLFSDEEFKPHPFSKRNIIESIGNISNTNDVEFANNLIKLFYEWHLHNYDDSCSYQNYYFDLRKIKNIEESKKINLKLLENVVDKLKKHKIINKLRQIKKSYSITDHNIITYHCNENNYAVLYLNLALGFINISAL